MSVFAQREAADIRAEWLGHLLSTEPADRPAAEAAISELYRLIGLDPPRFHWVASPVSALETVPPGVRLRASETVDRFADWPQPLGFRRLISELTAQLDVCVLRGYRPLDLMLRQLVRAPIAVSGSSTLAMALWSVQRTDRRSDFWYAALCASWSAHYDAVRRTSGVVFTPEQNV
ncbi:hypothetical protein [Spirillospora sp. NPDC048824]|uniref:hypothetical protein n=1 Tax=Spirillospora sp. NPDC048824 TaxID=3364526 RepID=UPI00371B6A55